jgi:hypothetical protein
MYLNGAQYMIIPSAWNFICFCRLWVLISGVYY